MANDKIHIGFNRRYVEKIKRFAFWSKLVVPMLRYIPIANPILERIRARGKKLRGAIYDNMYVNGEIYKGKRYNV